MLPHEAGSERTLRELQERAKELRCLYEVDALAGDTEAPLQNILDGIVSAMPPGWQHPAACRARVVCGDVAAETPGFAESAWMQRAAIRSRGHPIGFVEVAYADERPTADEGPFLKEERKLLETIAERIGHLVAHRRLLEAVREREAPPERSAQDWTVILELLRRTDRVLLLRVARKMINHLRFSGVRDVDRMFEPFAAPRRESAPETEPDENQPIERRAAVETEKLVDETFRIAAAHLGSAEILSCIHDWVRQDRASFLLDAVENPRASLAELADAIGRFLHMSRNEGELARPVAKGLRVSLVRRVLTGHLDYINVAKSHVDVADFRALLERTIYPSGGHGKIGGKGAGLFLAAQILKRRAASEPLLAAVRTPRTWYITSDGLHDFIDNNNLEDVFSHKYRDIEEIRHEYPDIVQTFKRSQFSPDILRGLSLALDDLPDRPLIVRSSSLLEDRVGAAFSGKYKSLFIANRGSKAERLEALQDAIAEVYASTFGPDPIEYRAERNLLDFSEGMGILIQEVVGTRVGDYFLPAFSGVAFSHNEFRWSPRIRRSDGLVRLVPGLGTRAVDRVGDDYPILLAPGQPKLRVNATLDEMIRYAPRFVDLISLASGRFETVELAKLVRGCGEFPLAEKLFSVCQDGRLNQPLIGQLDFARDDLVATFDGLVGRSTFVPQVAAMLAALEAELKTPVDLEFAHDGRDLYLLQCRPQNVGRRFQPAAIPRDLPADKVVFSARRHVSDGTIDGVTHIVYVDPRRYADIADHDTLTAVGRAVGRLNKTLPRKRFILMGPGRWGSRGDIRLGVRVTYADINNTSLLVEIAQRSGGYTPELSFGTHFFQDLVESSIRYLPLYPDDAGVAFNDAFLTRSRNLLRDFSAEFASLEDVVRVIDVRAETDGHTLCVLMNGDLDEAVGVLAPAGRAPEADLTPAAAPEPSAQHWRWRQRMAERVAAEIDPRATGVVAVYLFGSTENGSAGPGSDIDLLLHFRGTPAQQRDLTQWLAGWSLSLAEFNYLRTGYRSDGLLDVHFVSDDDIANKSSYAAKIGAVTDAARSLPLKGTAEVGD